MTLYHDYTGKIYDLNPSIIKRRVSGYATVLSPDNKLLVITPTYRGTYELPGGGINEEEKVVDGIIRECMEETGYEVEISDVQPLCVKENDFYLPENDTCYNGLMLVYPCRLKHDKQNLEAIFKDEVAKVEWIPLEELNENNFYKNFYPIIEMLRDKKF